MADQSAATDSPKAADEAPAPAAEAPKAAAEAKPAAPAPKPAVARTEKAAPAKARKPVPKTRTMKTKTKTAKVARTARASTNRNEGTRTMNKQTQDTIEAGRVAADQFRAAFGDVNERAKSAMERSARFVEEVTELTRGNVEALVASSKVAARGVETLSQEAADYGRRSFEDASNALKSFAEVRSATDFFKLQSDYARGAFEGYVAETAKLSETVLKLAGEVAEPITSRYSVAAERVKGLAA